MNNKTPAGELSDEQIHTALDSIDPEFWDVPMDGTLQFARAIIAADRELRRGDAGMPSPALMMGGGDFFTADQMHEYAQAALAAKDVELDAELKDRVALAMQIEGLRKDALTAAVTAFGLMATDYPKELPADAESLAVWITQHGLPLVPDDAGPEDLFIHIIRAAIATEQAK